MLVHDLCSTSNIVQRMHKICSIPHLRVHTCSDSDSDSDSDLNQISPNMQAKIEVFDLQSKTLTGPRRNSMSGNS